MPMNPKTAIRNAARTKTAVAIHKLNAELLATQHALAQQTKSCVLAYEERNKVIAALARIVLKDGGYSGIAIDPLEPEEEWKNVVVIALPAIRKTVMRLRWNFHVSHMPIFAALPAWHVHESVPEMTKDEVYDTLSAIAPIFDFADVIGEKAADKATLDRLANCDLGKTGTIGNRARGKAP